MRLLQLVQRQAGIARRKAKALIEQGRVVVNGELVENPFLEIEPAEIKELRVDGRDISLIPPETIVYKFYKPRGMLSSHYDKYHRNTVGRMLHHKGLRGFLIAGRLDRDAEGLLIITNDGRLVNVLTHPRYEIEKVYHVRVPRMLPYRHVSEVLKRMEKGVEDEGERLRIKRGRLLRRGPEFTELELVLTEGKKREIKRIWKHFRLPVIRLQRVALGPITLGDLGPGELRRVSTKERQALERLKAERCSTR